LVCSLNKGEPNLALLLLKTEHANILMSVFLQTEEEGYQSSSTEGPDRYLHLPCMCKGIVSQDGKKFLRQKLTSVSSVCTQVPCMCKGIVSQDKTDFLGKKLTSVSYVCTLHCFLLDKLKLKLLLVAVKHEKRP
jgi:hypothetical protein